MNQEAIEERIEEARSELIRLSPLYKEAVKNLKEVSKEVGYWSNAKYEAERKLIKVQKIAAYKGSCKRVMKVKKDPSVAELLASITSISSFDKEKLLTALMP